VVRLVRRLVFHSLDSLDRSPESSLSRVRGRPTECVASTRVHNQHAADRRRLGPALNCRAVSPARQPPAPSILAVGSALSRARRRRAAPAAPGCRAMGPCRLCSPCTPPLRPPPSHSHGVKLAPDAGRHQSASFSESTWPAACSPDRLGSGVPSGRTRTRPHAQGSIQHCQIHAEFDSSLSPLPLAPEPFPKAGTLTWW